MKHSVILGKKHHEAETVGCAQGERSEAEGCVRDAIRHFA